MNTAHWRVPHTLKLQVRRSQWQAALVVCSSAVIKVNDMLVGESWQRAGVYKVEHGWGQIKKIFLWVDLAKRRMYFFLNWSSFISWWTLMASVINCTVGVHLSQTMISRLQLLLDLKIPFSENQVFNRARSWRARYGMFNVRKYLFRNNQINQVTSTTFWAEIGAHV